MTGSKRCQNKTGESKKRRAVFINIFDGIEINNGNILNYRVEISDSAPRKVAMNIIEVEKSGIVAKNRVRI